MINKLPYEIIVIEANKLIVKMALSSNYFYYDLYAEYLKACGWNNYEFDNETLIQIEKNWDLLLKYKIEIWN